MKLSLKSLVISLFLNEISLNAYKLRSLEENQPDNLLHFSFHNQTDLCYLNPVFDKDEFCSGYQQFNRTSTPSGLLWQQLLDIKINDKSQDLIDLKLSLDFEIEEFVHIPVPQYIIERSKVEFIPTIQNRKDGFELDTSGEVGTCVDPSNCKQVVFQNVNVTGGQTNTFLIIYEDKRPHFVSQFFTWNMKPVKLAAEVKFSHSQTQRTQAIAETQTKQEEELSGDALVVVDANFAVPTVSGKINKGVQMQSWLVSTACLTGATSIIVASKTGMLRKRHQMNVVLKKADLGVPQTASDDQIFPPKPTTIKILRVQQNGDHDQDGFGIKIEDFVQIEENYYKLTNLEQDITIQILKDENSKIQRVKIPYLNGISQSMKYSQFYSCQEKIIQNKIDDQKPVTKKIVIPGVQQLSQKINFEKSIIIKETFAQEIIPPIPQPEIKKLPITKNEESQIVKIDFSVQAQLTEPEPIQQIIYNVQSIPVAQKVKYQINGQQIVTLQASPPDDELNPQIKDDTEEKHPSIKSDIPEIVVVPIQDPEIPLKKEQQSQTSQIPIKVEQQSQTPVIQKIENQSQTPQIPAKLEQQSQTPQVIIKEFHSQTLLAEKKGENETIVQPVIPEPKKEPAIPEPKKEPQIIYIYNSLAQSQKVKYQLIGQKKVAVFEETVEPPEKSNQEPIENLNYVQIPRVSAFKRKIKYTIKQFNNDQTIYVQSKNDDELVLYKKDKIVYDLNVQDLVPCSKNKGGVTKDEIIYDPNIKQSNSLNARGIGSVRPKGTGVSVKEARDHYSVLNLSNLKGVSPEKLPGVSQVRTVTQNFQIRPQSSNKYKTKNDFYKPVLNKESILKDNYFSKTKSQNRQKQMQKSELNLTAEIQDDNNTQQIPKSQYNSRWNKQQQ